jgi:hypothetical protein
MKPSKLRSNSTAILGRESHFELTLHGEKMAYRVIKKIKGKRYLYEQESVREGARVRTKCRCLGALDTPVYVNTTELGLDKIKPFRQYSIFHGEFGRVRVAYPQDGGVCLVEQLGDHSGKQAHLTLHPSGLLHRHGAWEKLTVDEAIEIFKSWIRGHDGL